MDALEKVRALERTVIRFAASRIASWYLHSPDLEERILHYLPDLYSLAVVAANEASYRLGLDRIFGYYSADFELTNACNLSCEVCPNNTELDTREKGYMDLELFRHALRTNPELRRVRLNFWGEPLLHPQLIDFVLEGKASGRYVSFHTNGTLMTEEIAEELIRSGIDSVIFSIDGVEEVYENIRHFPYQEVKRKIGYVLDARRRLGGETMVGVLAVGCPEVADIQDRIKREWRGVVDTLEIISYTSYDPDLPIRRTKPCRELWRGHLPIAWDGTVVACCPDFSCAMRLGNIRQDKLIDVINNDVFREFRRAHLSGRFTGPCRTCHEAESQSDISSRYN